MSSVQTTISTLAAAKLVLRLSPHLPPPLSLQCATSNEERSRLSISVEGALIPQPKAGCSLEARCGIEPFFHQVQADMWPAHRHHLFRCGQGTNT